MSISHASANAAALGYTVPVDPSRGPREYVVFMRQGYTVSEHFALLGQEVPCLARTESLYRAILTEDRLDSVKVDQGVIKVLQSSRTVPDDAATGGRSIRSFPVFKRAPGYTVSFICADGYSVEEHFACVNISCSWKKIGTKSYFAEDMSETQAKAALRDPMVDEVAENTYGTRC